MGYGWSVASDGKDLISGSDGTGGTFFARLVIHPPINVAFAGFTNCGNGNSAIDEAIEKISGFKWNTTM